jgi:stearoyl-CoA desaturase (delta-9 desaturase)
MRSALEATPARDRRPLTEPDRRPLSWMNISFLAAVHVVAVGGTVLYLATVGASLAAAILALVWTALTIFALSAGYHRLFSHRAYQANPVLRAFLLVFAAGAFQNSAITWASDHRRHHQRVDSPLDPYDARRGFWYAHVGWVLRTGPPATDLWPVPDLERDRLVAWQHRRYLAIATGVGFVAPWLVGWALGDAWGGLILGGLLRLVVVYHATFSINSVAHMVGAQPYSDRDTSRDSFLTALVSMGEGYHNFHHTFPGDYRNGVRPFQFDPSKWTIRLLAAVGLARNLKRTPHPAIARARLRMEARRLEARPLPDGARARLRELRAELEAKYAEWQALLARREKARQQRRQDLRRSLGAEIGRTRRSIRQTYRDWRVLGQSSGLVAG